MKKGGAGERVTASTFLFPPLPTHIHQHTRPSPPTLPPTPRGPEQHPPGSACALLLGALSRPAGITATGTAAGPSLAAAVIGGGIPHVDGLVAMLTPSPGDWAGEGEEREGWSEWPYRSEEVT